MRTIRKKGTPLLITGKIQTRDYTDNSGIKRYVTEIIVDELELLGGNKQQGAPAPAPDDYDGGYYGPADDGDLPAGM